MTHATYTLVHSFGSDAIGDFPQGGRGVDVFLVISGFIMVHITKNRKTTPERFALDRLTRIAPLYWIFTGLMVLVVMVAPALVNATGLGTWHTISSYLFIPSIHPDDNAIQPILRVGWTLNIEMFFYLLIVLAMMINMKYWARIVIVWVLILAMIGTITKPAAPTFDLWTSAYMLHFAAGMVLGRLCDRLPALHPAVSLGLILAGFAVLLTMPIQGTHGVTPQFLLITASATAIVFGALTLERANALVRIRGLATLGNASYALYLSHYFVLGVVRVVWPDGASGTLAYDLAFLVTVLVVASAVSVGVYKWIERPLTLFLRGTRRARTAPARPE